MENVIKTKSKDFAIRIIKLYKYLCQDKNEYILSKQLLRSGTSVGANINEALCGISKRDFLSKIYISFKECTECQYWLELLYATHYIDDKEFYSINQDCKELIRILSSITKTTRERINNS